MAVALQDRTRRQMERDLGHVAADIRRAFRAEAAACTVDGRRQAAERIQDLHRRYDDICGQLSGLRD